MGEIDVLVTPLGGGGLLSGCSIAATRLLPQCRVFGVEPAAGNDGQQSFRSGSIVQIATPKTIADGAQTPRLGDHTFPVIRALVEDILTVSDEELIDTMAFLAGRMKLVVEPTGCLAAAAVLHGKIPVAGKRVGIVLSGGNVDLDRFAALTTGRAAQASVPWTRQHSAGCPGASFLARHPSLVTTRAASVPASPRRDAMITII